MESLKSQVNKRFNSLENEYQKGWKSSHQDIATYINPTRGRYDDNYNRGEMIDHQTLLDGYATNASRILASGLLSGMTSPSRPWFKLSLDNVVLDQVPGVRVWLDEVQRRMLEIMNKSNIYAVLHGAYEEIGMFGTSCFAILEDFDDVVRARGYTSGEYYLGTDSRGRVNTFGREFWLQVSQVVEDFGLDNVSTNVRNKWDQNRPDEWIKVRHIIEPNKTRIEGMEDFENMPYRSLYWEMGSNNDDQFLAKSGFKRFPILAPRWDTVTTDNIYGYGPGWHALGDVKQLQKTVLDKLIAQEKLHNPPMLKDSAVEGYLNLLPGGVSTTSGNVANGGVQPAYQINPNLESFLQMEQHLKESIDRFFFVNLFLMMMNDQRANVTATEVAERQQEKVMMMGPILHRLQEELLDPMIELIFGIMADNFLLPQPPAEIEGVELKVQYVSILAQAQQALGVGQIERVVGFVGSTSQIDPSSLDNINFDEAVRAVADMEGAPAKIINDKEIVDAIREQRAQQQALAASMQAAQAGAGVTKTLADAKTSEESALTGLIGV